MEIGLERGLRDDSKEELQKQIRGERQSFAGVHGEKSLPVVGLDRPPEQKPLALYRQAKAILESLRQPGLDLEARSSAIVIDPQVVANEMEPMVESLGRSLERIDRILKESVEALVGRRKALRLQREVYVDVARCQESLFRLIDEDGIADRIRPSLRRATRRKKNDEAEAKQAGSENGEASGEGEAAENGEAPQDGAASSSGEPSGESPSSSSTAP